MKIKHFSLEERLGQGGFGEVFRARDTILNRDVAIKILLPELSNDPELLERFKNGGEVASKLNHPHIIKIYSMDELSREQIFFTVMEYLPGGTLFQLIQQKKMTLPAALQTIKQIASAIDHAHTHQIVHRDLKPTNILYTHDNQLVVTDFDLSRSIGGKRITQPGSTVGSLHYLSPEQARGEEVIPQSDIYSLGAMLYCMFTGTPPFDVANRLELLKMHLNAPRPLLHPKRPDLPIKATHIIQKAMSVNPKHRYVTAQALYDDLVDVSRMNEAAIESALDPTEKKPITRLQIVTGKQAGKVFPLESQEISIGYSRTPHNHIALDDDYVSNEHGKLSFLENNWYFTDLGSRNGSILVYSDGRKQRIIPHEPIKLSVGEILELGNTLLRLTYS
jgi:serine/threonine-protein kinase